MAMPLFLRIFFLHLHKDIEGKTLGSPNNHGLELERLNLSAWKTRDKVLQTALKASN